MTTSETTLRTFDFAGLELRVIMHMAEPWFVGADVCKALGLYVRANGTAEVNTAVRHLGHGERDTYPVRTDTGLRRLICLSESGLYKLIMRSDKPEARKFQDWVTRDVLPAIRKTGGYLLNEEARDTAKADDRRQECLGAKIRAAQINRAAARFPPRGLLPTQALTVKEKF